MIIVAFVCLYVYCVQSVSCLESIGNSLWHCGWVKMEKGPVLLLDQKWWILSYRAPVGADKSRKEKNLNQNISSLQSTLWSRRVQAKNLKRIFLISEYNQSINYSTLIHCEKKQTLSTLRTNPSSRPPMRRNPQDLSSSTIALTTRGAINIWTIVLLNVTLIMLMLRVDFYFYVNGSDGNGSNDNDGNPKLAIS